MKQRGFEVITKYKGQAIHLPTRKTEKSAGYDIEAAEEVVIAPHTCALVPTGLKAYMGEREYLGIHIRSSLAMKQKLMLANAQGIIDADYYNNADNEGHIMIGLFSWADEPITIMKGTRIAQGIFYTYLTADGDEEAEKEVRSGGFGSTGK